MFIQMFCHKSLFHEKFAKHGKTKLGEFYAQTDADNQEDAETDDNR